MGNSVGYLPITVVAAISLFVLKELIEAIKKSAAKKRKLRAYKQILAEEIERNYWVWTSLRRTIERIRISRLEGEEKTYRISTSPSGAQLVEAYYSNGELSSSSVLENVSRISFERLMVNVAEEDAKLHFLASEAYDELSELGHVRAGVVNYLRPETDYLLDSFLDYAIDTIDSALPSMKSFYYACTGKTLEQYKIR